MIPTTRLWLFLCLLSAPAMAAGFIPRASGFVLLADLVLLSCALVDHLLARAVKVELHRELPNKLSVGAANKVTLALHNRAQRAVSVLIQDDVPDALEATPQPVPVVLEAGARVRASYRATPTRRGRFEFGDLHLRVRGPLGLIWHQRTVKAPASVSVYPDLRGTALLLSSASVDLRSLGLRELRRDGRGSEFSRLRDYAQGDSVREVDWKATARRTRPVTRVMESERSQMVMLCVDAGRSMAARVEGLTKLDHAVNAALFLAFIALRHGDRVGLIVFADGVKSFLPPNTGKLQYRRIVDALFATRASLTYTDYDALFRELDTRVRRRSLLCLFTDLLDEEQGARIAIPLRRLSRRHVPLCLTVKDTGLLNLLGREPTSPEEAFQHAAASELLADRERMKAAVARDGVQLLDVAADELTVAAVNRYVEIKSRGVL